MLHCPRCQRAHPDEALFCSFDGERLREAGEALSIPTFETTVERIDSASGVSDRPELELQPRKLPFDPQHANEVRGIELRVLNIGGGLLQGLIRLEDAGDWLRFTGGAGECVIETAEEQAVLLEADTHGLAAPQSLAARLNVITNGGVVEVPVRLDVSVRPFPQPPFGGALTPRDLAVAMRADPKPAAALLENGDVTRWFASNGWPAPIQGPIASGKAAVQQFFESLKLTRPPRVMIEPALLTVVCHYPANVAGQAILHSPERKWVYGQVTCAAPWVRIHTPQVSGPQEAVIRFEIESAALTAEREHEASVQVIANGGQELLLQVRAVVRQPPQPWRGRFLRALGVGALCGLLLRLVIAEPALRWAVGQASSEAALIRYFVLATAWLGAAAALLLVPRQPGWRWSDLAGGLLAGLAGGVAASATLVCLLPWLDAGARRWLTWTPGPLAVLAGWALAGAALAAGRFALRRRLR